MVVVGATDEQNDVQRNLRTLTQLIKISLIMAVTWLSCLATVSGCQIWTLYLFFCRFSVSNHNFLIQILRSVWPTLVVPIPSFTGWWKWSGTIMNGASLTHMCTKGVNWGQYGYYTLILWNGIELRQTRDHTQTGHALHLLCTWSGKSGASTRFRWRNH